MKKTKIIATIGPETQDIDVLKELILNGVNVVRLNLSHASHNFLYRYFKEDRNTK